MANLRLLRPCRVARVLAIVVASVVLVAPIVRLPRAAAEGRITSDLRVIVNPRNSVISVDRKFLADAFFKRVTRWGHLEAIRPVDLRPDAPARLAFSEAVLRRSVAAVKTYWQQAVFAGRDVPPPELETEDEVVRFVLRNPGAVGYVSGAANIGNARVLPVK